MVFCQNVPKLLISHIGVIFPICLNQVTNNKNKIRYLQHNPLKPSPSPGGSVTILTTQKTAPCPPSTTTASPSWRWRSSCPRERWKSRSNIFILCENSYYYITYRTWADNLPFEIPFGFATTFKSDEDWLDDWEELEEAPRK